MSIKIGITTGDVDGIGVEVTVKSLLRLGPQRGTQFFLWTSLDPEAKQFRKLKNKFKIFKTSSLDEALDLRVNQFNAIFHIASPRRPANWVEEAAQACVYKKLSAMVTAPLSKPEIAAAGLKDIGHTDILKRLCGSDSAFMGFIGKHFNVVLATGHIPISQISSSLRLDTVSRAVMAARQLSSLLPRAQARRPIALLGLNPHAGDQGLIGSEEEGFLKSVVKKERHLMGPLVPDVAFQKDYWKKYSCYIACYHDQGLIPFKAVHGHESGVHLTLGLTLKRTSVDHGTAKDIFGKNRANPNSMYEAIKWATVWAKRG